MAESTSASHNRALDMLAMAIGLAAWYLCSNWVSTLTYDMTVHHWWINRSGAEIAAIIIAVVLFSKIKSTPRLRIVDWLAALIYAASIILLSLPLADSPLWATAALAGFGASQIWMLARWSSRLAAASTSTLVRALLAAIALIALVKLALALMPIAAGSTLMALIPLLAAAMLVFHREDAPAPERQWFSKESLRSFTPLASAIAAFFLVWSVLNFILKRETGHYGAGESASFAFTLLSQIILLAIAAFVAWWVIARKNRLDITVVWKLSYALMASALFLFVLLGTNQLIQALTGAAVVVAKMFLWLALVNMARHSTFQPWLVVCLGQLLYSVPDCLGRAVASAWALASVETVTAAALLLGIVVVVAFCLPDRSPAAMNLLSDMNQETSRAPSDADTLDRRCESLGKAHGLSKREVEILQFLCKGRSRPYIAETLYLSENTVRTHSKHIYQKLNVHTRQELLDLVSEVKELS